jgi:hypothetical protein
LPRWFLFRDILFWGCCRRIRKAGWALDLTMKGFEFILHLVLILVRKVTGKHLADFLYVQLR